jgi:hypothetical protein
MKPKRPTEQDLLAIVQNGFEAQLPKDREAQQQAPAGGVVPEGQPGLEVAPLVPMVRITLTIPEELRFRLKLAVMNHRRTSRDRMTQDEFCAQAIALHLDKQEPRPAMPGREEPLLAFLRECLERKGLARSWAPKARELLASFQSAPGPGLVQPAPCPGPRGTKPMPTPSGQDRFPAAHPTHPTTYGPDSQGASNP